jgi:hypothetical protein
LDVRGVLFGRALAVGIARHALQMAKAGSLPGRRLAENEMTRRRGLDQSQQEIQSRWYDLTIRVHVQWLMSPREDLENNPPRHFLHLGRDWVERELNNRQQQWSRERAAPRALDLDTFAYRHGPLGRHEVVMYFDLCREVISAAWDRIVEDSQIEVDALAEALHGQATLWLAEGSIDGDPLSPAVIIENERRRMPLVGDGSHLDCDCPLCRMQAEDGFGPMFEGFDGHHLELDEEFAFSLCETREEWEDQQEEYREFGERMDDLEAEREVAGEDPFESAWKCSYVNEEALAGVPPSSLLSVMALATRVAELVGDLKSDPAQREIIDALNLAFDAYRNSQEDHAMAGATAKQLAAVLEDIATKEPQLTAKAADLQSLLDQRHRRDQRSY